VSGLVEWVMFLSLAGVALTTAAGMLLTMSMYRAGLALMSCFVAIAGLFVLLDADLLAAIQIMMNVGGMLVMILFMVMIMLDPGGEMMWDMKRKMNLPGPGALSMRMPRGRPPPVAREKETPLAAPAGDWTCPMHPEVSTAGPGECPQCGMALVPREELEEARPSIDHSESYTCPMHLEIRRDQPGQCPVCGMNLIAASEQQPVSREHESDGSMVRSEEQQASDQAHHHDDAGGHDEMHGQHGTPEEPGAGMAGMTPRQHYQMMVDMAMSTVQLPWALVVGAASAVLLTGLVIRAAWPLSPAGPTQDATVMVGELLLSRYMIGFEGAAFLILAGITGAVIFAKREGAPPTRKPAETTRLEATRHTCPMHREIQQAGPGQCPVCGMNLVLVEAPPEPAGPGEHHGGHT